MSTFLRRSLFVSKFDYEKLMCRKNLSGKPKEDKPVAKKVTDPKRIFKIYRYGGILSREEPKVQTFELDVSKCGKMVLDALIAIKAMDRSLAFRMSCREGICGSCAVNLQGMNTLACITEIPDSKTITIYPLPHMYVKRDLVVDMDHFYEGYKSIRPYLVRSNEIPFGSSQYAQSIEDNLKMIGMYECVLCACCSTACPSYWWNGRRFLGPASLMHAYRWVIDSRDGDTEKRLMDLKDDFRAFRCHSIFNCSITCPKGLHPGEKIAKLKRLITKLDKKPMPEQEPMSFSKGVGGCVKKC